MKPKPFLTVSTLLIAVACNQSVYDSIYKAIILEALRVPGNFQATFDHRNTAIETLRSLCRGQRSSFERPAWNRRSVNRLPTGSPVKAP